MPYCDKPQRLRSHTVQKTNQLIRSVLRFRKLPIPVFPKPLAVPWLSHPSFHTQLRQRLRRQVATNKQFFPPLHLPNPSVVQTKSKTLGDSLFNWRTLMVQWINKPPTCRRTHFSDDLKHQGHVACPGQAIATADNLFSLFAEPCNTAYYPAKSQYSDILAVAVNKWFDRYGVQIQPELVKELAETLWKGHCAHNLLSPDQVL